MPAHDPNDYNSKVDSEKIDSFVKWASILWLYISFMAAIMRGGQMTGWDVAGVIVGTTTAFGYWLKFSSRRIAVEAGFAIKFLLFLAIVTVLIAWPLGYFGFV